ncbi:hypothetical protein FJ527_26480 [Mesorhizobium sp. B2-4-18]|uniref:hypothetical protein n=1 Tax=Mesorhizobium sp. B2-4-18 TaxID=2589931 RepID=UPI00112D6155|nr:hypothetical protein [Mesorhizobium sp. B2-4-18]TPK71591.1 hypothetical protein FJ527_26480 [Mesorhizobium sp. B2-4-18]
MSDPWHPLVTYTEGERCRYLGETYQAKFDLTRGLKPTGHLAEKFWRKLPTIAVSKTATKAPSAPNSKDLRRGLEQALEVLERGQPARKRTASGYLHRSMSSD